MGDAVVSVFAVFVSTPPAIYAAVVALSLIVRYKVLGLQHRGHSRPESWDDFFSVAASMVEYSRDNKAEAIQALEELGEWDQYHLLLFMSTIQAEFCGFMQRSSRRT